MFLCSILLSCFLCQLSSLPQRFIFILEDSKCEAIALICLPNERMNKKEISHIPIVPVSLMQNKDIV